MFTSYDGKIGHRAGAFTLLELLVSVSVTVVLASLLLPALASTRERTDRIQCVDNQRQIILAWSLFANDHRGHLPANGYSPAGGSLTEPRWVQGYLNPMAAPGDLANEELLRNPAYSQLAAYLPRADVYHCPSDRPTDTINPAQTTRIRSYSMNAYVGWASIAQRPIQPGYRVFQNWDDMDSPGPARVMVLIDVRPESICWPFFGVNMNAGADAQFFAYPASYHNGGAQVVFADGHVERHKWRDQRTVNPGNLLFHGHDTPSPGNADLAWLRSVATTRK